MPICAIVGVGPRIGNGVAQAFAKRGSDIVMISRDSSHTREYGEAIRELGVAAHSVAFDATDRAATHEGFQRIIRDIGLPDVVIYNPANMVMAPFSKVSPDDMEQTWPIMLYAPMNVVASVVPAMKERGSGTLLFTGGGFGIDPSVQRAPHSIAKAALRNYAHGLFLELADAGIHAGTVTVHRPIEQGDDMERCAQNFVALHEEPTANWSWEKHYGK